VTAGIAREDERSMLTGFLDWYRGVAEHKVAGLTFEEATRVSTPTGLTILGTINHLAWVEKRWFEYHFKGEDPDDLDAHRSFELGPTDTIESVLERYRGACAEARRTVADEPSLDALAKVEHRHFGATSLRWILLHMIEETARHAGHLDIVRELTDGRTGD
jgi:uncharacterized damage-inducible protein DinB